MLEGIRKRRSSIIIMLVFGVIILVFIFWGVGPSDKGKERAVASVDGTSIPVRDYVNLYKRQTEYYKNVFKGQFNEDVARKLDLKHRSLDLLINRALAIKEAHSEGIKVSDQEVQQEISGMEAFSKNGAFDKDTYFKVLGANRIKPADFEKSIAEDLLSSRVRDKVVKEVKVTDEEITQAYRKENRLVDYNYVAFDAARYISSVKVTDDEAKAYMQKNSSDFALPVKVKAAYAKINPASYVKAVKVTDAQAKDFYGKNQDKFKSPERFRARHILIRPDVHAADKDAARKAALAKAEDILKRVKAGEDFSTLAQKYSEDPGSARRGGDLGWFSKGMMVKPFEAAVLTLKKGDVSRAVETEFGYHIIKLEDVKEASVEPYRYTESQIKSFLAMEAAVKAARDDASALEKDFRAAGSVDELKKAASRHKTAVSVTGFITENGSGDEVAKNEKLRDVVFTLKSGQTSLPIDTPQGIYVIKAVERTESRVPEYKEIAGKVKERVALEKAKDEARKTAQEFLKKVQGTEDFSRLASKDRLKVENTGGFKHLGGVIPKIGVSVSDKEKLFELTLKAPVYPEVLERGSKFYVLKLKSAAESDEKGLQAVKEILGARLLAQRQEKAVEKWLEGMRAKARIKVYEENM